MDFKNNLQLFLESSKTKNFIQFFNHDLPSTLHQSFNYIGVNFSENQLVSIKLYYAFFTAQDINIAKHILPSLNEFEKYSKFYKESHVIDKQNQGCTFTLKANSNFDFTIGFGLRFPLISNIPFEFPRYIHLTEKDLKNYQGICFEYSDDNIVKKRNYYYITDIITKQKIAEEWNNPSIEEADVIEYTETGSERKIIIWNYDVTNPNKKARVCFSDEHKAFNKWIESDFNLKNLIDGEYLTRKEKASYFYDLHETHKGPYDLNAMGSVDTIKSLLIINK